MLRRYFAWTINTFRNGPSTHHAKLHKYVKSIQLCSFVASLNERSVIGRAFNYNSHTIIFTTFIRCIEINEITLKYKVFFRRATSAVCPFTGVAIIVEDSVRLYFSHSPTTRMSSMVISVAGKPDTWPIKYSTTNKKYN